MSKAGDTTYPTLGAVDFLVLVCLSSADGYGYRLVREIRERSRGRVELLPGNLYAMLNRMEATGWIARSGRRKPSEGGPPRTYYRITSLGRRVVAAEASRLTELLSDRDVKRLLRESPG